MGMVLIDQGLLNIALRALRRDADGGLTIRGEIADEVENNCVPIGEPVAYRRKNGNGFEYLRGRANADTLATGWEPMYVLPTHNGQS